VPFGNHDRWPMLRVKPGVGLAMDMMQAVLFAWGITRRHR